MNFVETYMKLYPDDKVTLVGGAAAYLILQHYGKEIPLKDIDVNIETTESGETILKRWTDILPLTYTPKYDPKYAIVLFTMIDTTNEGLPFDIFIGKSYFLDREQIGPFYVEEKIQFTTRLFQELEGRKVDIELMHDGQIFCLEIDVLKYIEKYQRLLTRLGLLIECLERTRDV